MREAHGAAESKDLYSTRTAAPPQGVLTKRSTGNGTLSCSEAVDVRSTFVPRTPFAIRMVRGM